jgi:hypothetical protein
MQKINAYIKPLGDLMNYNKKKSEITPRLNSYKSSKLYCALTDNRLILQG